MTTPLANSSRDYARIAEAIGYLHAHRRDQPDLAMLARHLSLSEAHLQRLFTRWAGISPKRFLQSLTLDYARARLDATRDVLSLSLEAGLSGPGRLHDLFVTLDAVSPGEAKSGGLGLLIRYGVHPTPFGAALIATSARGICKLHFLAAGEDPELLLRADWPYAILQVDTVATATLAAGIGHPRAARAVGNAVAANPLAYLIPCHRVIRESGALGGYRWGLIRKSAIQGWESVREE